MNEGKMSLLEFYLSPDDRKKMDIDLNSFVKLNRKQLNKFIRLKDEIAKLLVEGMANRMKEMDNGK